MLVQTVESLRAVDGKLWRGFQLSILPPNAHTVFFLVETLEISVQEPYEMLHQFAKFFLFSVTLFRLVDLEFALFCCQLRFIL